MAHDQATGKIARLDARGMKCPWPALRAARLLRTGAAVEILADDPVAPRELAALAAHHGWRFGELARHHYLIAKT